MENVQKLTMLLERLWKYALVIRKEIQSPVSKGVLEIMKGPIFGLFETNLVRLTFRMSSTAFYI